MLVPGLRTRAIPENRNGENSVLMEFLGCETELGIVLIRGRRCWGQEGKQGIRRWGSLSNQSRALCAVGLQQSLSEGRNQGMQTPTEGPRAKVLG